MAELFQPSSAQIRDIIGLPETLIKLGPIHSIIETSSVLDLGPTGDVYLSLDQPNAKILARKDFDVLGNVIQFTERTTPANPPANQAKMYAKDVGGITKPFWLDSAGTETDILTADQHDLLSATHPDTTPATVLRGALVTGQLASPKWQLLALGGSATFLRSDGTDALWTAIVKADLPSTIVYTDQTNTFGAFAQRFPTTQLQLDNPAGTFQYIFATSAIIADRTVTLPLLIGNDTLVFESHIQTLTGKTLTTPTIASFVNATHDHSNAAGGGQLTNTALVSGVFAAITGIGAQSQALNMNGFDINNVEDIELNETGSIRTISMKRAETLVDDTVIAEIKAQSNDGVPTIEDFGNIVFTMESDAVGSEDGSIKFQVAEAGVHRTNFITLNDASLGTIELLKPTNVTGNLDTSGTFTAATYVGQTSIVTVGTIATGVWQGTVIDEAFLDANVVLNNKANVFGDFDQTFKDNRLRIANPADTFFVNFQTSAEIASRVLTIPLLGANRTIVVTGLASQIVIGTEVTGASTALTDTADIAYLNTANTYSAGLKQTVDTDATNAGFRDLGHTADPSSAQSGDKYYNTTSNEYKWYNGTVWKTFAESGGAGESNTISSLGGGTVLTAAVPKSGVDLRTVSIATTAPIAHSVTTDLMTFTLNALVNADIAGGAAIVTSKLADSANFVLINQANIFGDFDQTFKDNRLRIENPAGTFEYQITAGAIAADRILNLPIITGTDTLTVLGLAQSWTAKQTFQDDSIDISNPADTFQYTIQAAAIVADRVLNLPLTLATDTLAVLGLAQTFTVLQTFENDAFKLLPTAGDASAPADGQQWYNSTTNKFRARENGVSVDMIGGGGVLVQEGTVELGSVGTSLLVDGLSIDLSDAGAFSQVVIYWNLRGLTSKIITGKLNAGSSHTGEVARLNGGSEVYAAYSATATIPISKGVDNNPCGAGNMTIGTGEHTGSVKTMSYFWRYNVDNDMEYGTGKLLTTASTTFTGFEIIGSANIDAGATMTVYSISRTE